MWTDYKVGEKSKKRYYDLLHPDSCGGEENVYEAVEKDGKYEILHYQIKGMATESRFILLE